MMVGHAMLCAYAMSGPSPAIMSGSCRVLNK